MRPVRLFISHSDNDVAYIDRLDKHLSVLRREGLVDHWHCGRLAPGDDADALTQMHLEDSDIILLGISADYLASERLHSSHLSSAIHRQDEGRTRVIPLVLRPVEWASGALGRLQPLPKSGRPISNWQDQDEAWLEVVRGLRQVIDESRRNAALSAEKEHLQQSLATALEREHALQQRVEVLSRELAELRSKNRRFDEEVELASARLREEAQRAQNRLAEETIRSRDLEVHRDFLERRLEASIAHDQDLRAQFTRLTEEARKSRGTIRLLAWRSEAQLELVSGGGRVSTPSTVDWMFTVFNLGPHRVRLTRREVNWLFFDPKEPKSQGVVLLDEAEFHDFPNDAVLSPGQRSDDHHLTFDVRSLDGNYARQPLSRLRPLLRVHFESTEKPYSSASPQRSLEWEDRRTA